MEIASNSAVIAGGGWALLLGLGEDFRQRVGVINNSRGKRGAMMLAVERLPRRVI